MLLERVDLFFFTTMNSKIFLFFLLVIVCAKVGFNDDLDFINSATISVSDKIWQNRHTIILNAVIANHDHVINMCMLCSPSLAWIRTRDPNQDHWNVTQCQRSRLLSYCAWLVGDVVGDRKLLELSYDIKLSSLHFYFILAFKQCWNDVSASLYVFIHCVRHILRDRIIAGIWRPFVFLAVAAI